MNTRTGHYKQMVKELETVRAQSGHAMHRVVDDFVALVFWAVQRRDPEYLAVLEGYDNGGAMGARPADHFCNAFACLVLHSQASGEEAFGPLFLEFSASDHMGQFFTPWNLCLMMAQMIGPRGGERILEPACGAGAMIVACARVMGPEATAQSWFFAQDLDMRCVMMTTVNMWLFGVPGVVVLGDTLTLETRRVFRVAPRPGAMTVVAEIPADEAVAAGLVFDREAFLAKQAQARAQEAAAQAAAEQEARTGQVSMLGLMGEAS